MHNRNVCNNYLTLIVQQYVVQIQDGCPILLLIMQYRLKNRNTPWINRSIINKMYTRDHLHRKAKVKKCNELWRQYTNLRNDIVTELRNAEKVYYAEQIEIHKGHQEPHEPVHVESP